MPVRRVADLPGLTPEERDALADALARASVRYDNLFETSFPYSLGFHARPSDGGEHAVLAAARRLFPPAAALGDCPEVSGGLRASGRAAATT